MSNKKFVDETNSPFSSAQATLLNQLLASLNETQRAWLSGYLTAYWANRPAPKEQDAGLGTAALTAAISEASEIDIGEEQSPAVADTTISMSQAGGDFPITILYGTETENAHKLSNCLGEKLQEAGWQINIVDMNDYRPQKLKKERCLLIITSTHGDGDPPEPAKHFVEFLQSKRAPSLSGIRYSVLALGDSTYEYFCQCGVNIDKRMQELDGECIFPRQECDVEYEEDASNWMTSVCDALQAIRSGQTSKAAAATDVITAQDKDAAYSKEHPYLAEILEFINLNDIGSSKDTYHIELSLEDSKLEYTPGDSVGIYPQNDHDEVDALIKALNLATDAVVPGVNKQEKTLREALIYDYEISRITRQVIKNYADITHNGLAELVGAKDKSVLRDYMHGRTILDMVMEHPAKNLSASEFVSILRHIPPRFYSIASSLHARPEEVHIVITVSKFKGLQNEKLGVFSHQTHHHLQVGDKLPLFMHENPAFALPEDSNTPIIMIGAGTGIAPYRSFLEEREEKGDGGPTWLFMGDRNFRTDFMYQLELQKFLEDGVLTRIDLAFSRDQTQKIYVQDRIEERGKELFKWLHEDGAYVYVCGEAFHMAPAVHQALMHVIEVQSGCTEGQAQRYLENLIHDKRYLRDVY